MGATGSITDRGNKLNASKMAASQVGAMTPGMPMVRSIERLNAESINPRTATFIQMMEPTIMNRGQKIFYTDSLGREMSGDSIARKMSILTGGTVPWPIDPHAKDTIIDRAMLSAEWSMPRATPDANFQIGKTFGPLSESAYTKYWTSVQDKTRTGIENVEQNHPNFFSLKPERQKEILHDIYLRSVHKAKKEAGISTP